MADMIEIRRRLAAIRDFRRARQQAALQQIMARLTGQSADLLSFDEVRERLKLKSGSSLGLQDIPLDAIVGSAGRYTEFTRSFLPKKDEDQARWARVEEAAISQLGLPPRLKSIKLMKFILLSTVTIGCRWFDNWAGLISKRM